MKEKQEKKAFLGFDFSRFFLAIQLNFILNSMFNSNYKLKKGTDHV